MSDYSQIASFIAEIRSMIQHENNLLNQRMVWMWTLQGLLFGAMSFLWKFHWLPVIIISLVGLFSCISIGYSLNRANQAIKDLLAIAENYKRSKGEDIELPPTIGSRTKAIEWLLPWKFLPWVLSFAWTGIILFRILCERSIRG